MAARAWLVVAVGAGFGFVARDVLHLSPRAVAGAWLGGALAAVLPALGRHGRGGGERGQATVGRERGQGTVGGERDRATVSSEQDRATVRGERGQATVEWIGLVLLAALALASLGAFASAATRGDAWSFAGFLTHRIVCAATGCDDGRRRLARAYGERDAALVRGLAPNLAYESGERQLPVDWRRCRARRCANGTDERDVDVHRSGSGEGATVFTRLLRRNGRTYVQYWLFYPDSNTAVAGSDKLWEVAWLVPRLTGLVERAPPYPGFHRDDWEGYAIRLDPDGSAWVRASAHGDWSDWAAGTGWVRVERGSHAGRLPGPEGHERNERTTTGEGLRLIPLETLDKRGYRPHSHRVEPPWRKDAYRDPESPES